MTPSNKPSSPKPPRYPKTTNERLMTSRMERKLRMALALSVRRVRLRDQMLRRPRRTARKLEKGRVKRRRLVRKPPQPSDLLDLDHG